MKASLIDIVHLQPYLYLLHTFNTEDITAAEFETVFLAFRRQDQYLLSDQFDEDITHLLRELFNAVDDYTSAELYDENDTFNITEQQLRSKTSEILEKLNLKILK